jgi:hypothetical protein
MILLALRVIRRRGIELVRKNLAGNVESLGNSGTQIL